MIESTVRPGTISLPVRVLLTDAGIDFFVRTNKPFARFSLADKFDERGVTLTGFTAETLQKMILRGYVHKIELAIRDFVRERRDVMDLHKLITFSSLYQQYDLAVREILLGSEAVRRWNRIHPRQALSSVAAPDRDVLTSAVHHGANELGHFKRAIVNKIGEDIRFGEVPRAAEVANPALLAEKALSTLEPVTDFLLLLQMRSPEVHRIAMEIREQLHMFFPRCLVPDYSALLLLELLATSVRSAPDGCADSPDNAVAHVIWKVRNRRPGLGERARLHVVSCDRTVSYSAMKAAVNARSETSVKRKSLNDFYEQAQATGEDPDLGLYYLSFVRDSCRTVGILFDAYVQRVPSGDSTLINFSFAF